MLALIIFAITLFGILRRPFGLSIWVYSSFGAVAALAFGLVELHDLGVIFALIWDSALTLIALIVISFCLQGLGFFEWLIFYVLKFCADSRHSPHATNPESRAHLSAALHINTTKAFVALILLSATLSAVLANDGAVLVLTPLVLGLFLRAKNALPLQIIAFLFATAFVCDISSNPLIISNLTNIITAHFHALGFAEFALAMLLPNLFGIFGALMLFLVLFRAPLRTPLTFRTPSKPKLQNALFALHCALLVVFIASFFLSTHFNLPLSLNCAVYAGILLVALWRKSRQKAIATMKRAPFGIIVFVFGLFVVVFGVQKLDFTEAQNALFHALIALYDKSEVAGIFGVASVSALGSSVINNLPMVLFGNLAIDEFFGAQTLAVAQNLQNLAQNLTQGFAQNFDTQSYANLATQSQNLKESFIYAHLLGCNIGSKLTPIGSLCTLLWLSLIAKSSTLTQKGVNFTFLHYCKYSLIFTLPTLFLATLGLYISHSVF